METIYYHLNKNPMFEPYILCLHHLDYLVSRESTQETYKASIKKDLEENIKNLNDKGFRVISPYTGEDLCPVPIETYCPDIIIHNNPNLIGESWFKSKVIGFNFLTIFMHYGLNVIDNSSYHYNNKTGTGVCMETYFPQFILLQKFS